MKPVEMRRPPVGVTCVVAAFVLVSCFTNRVPDISLLEAASIISRAPEFNRYARLVNVKSLHNQKGSMAGVCFGAFTFLYLNSPVGTDPIAATVDFRYHESKWYLNEFGYGCPHDCHSVEVYDGPDKHTAR